MSLDHARFAVSRLNVVIEHYEGFVETGRVTLSPGDVQYHERKLDIMRGFRQDIRNHVNNNSPTLQAVSSLSNNNNNSNN